MHLAHSTDHLVLPPVIFVSVWKIMLTAEQLTQFIKLCVCFAAKYTAERVNEHLSKYCCREEVLAVHYREHHHNIPLNLKFKLCPYRLQFLFHFWHYVQHLFKLLHYLWKYPKASLLHSHYLFIRSYFSSQLFELVNRQVTKAISKVVKQSYWIYRVST